MEAGKLRNRVTIQSPSYTQNPATGAMTPTWNDVVTLWAQVEALSGRDYIAAQAHQSAISARVTIRFRNDITRNMRLLFDGNIYTIEAILPDNKSGREYLTLMVSLGTRKE